MESLRIPAGIGSLNLFLRHANSDASHRGLPVLILHGATFPSGNAAAWKIEGKSWMDDLAEHGYDVYALDFLGYGESDNYPEMASENSNGPALGDISSMVGQVDRAIAAISKQYPDTAVILIAHSAGTLVAARYAELHADRIARLVLFGAPAPDNSRQPSEGRRSRYIQVTADDQLNAFEPRVRQSGKLDSGMFSAWVAAYLATDMKSATRQPASVRVPAGMVAALDELQKSGKLPYDPARITTPTLIIQGEWDAVTPPSQGLWLFEHFGSSLKRLVVLNRAGHRLHLEQNRFQLYEEVRAFLQTRE
jgi:pimeloyl-ACP methyl ester carboxylesterase